MSRDSGAIENAQKIEARTATTKVILKQGAPTNYFGEIFLHINEKHLDEGGRASLAPPFKRPDCTDGDFLTVARIRIL